MHKRSVGIHDLDYYLRGFNDGKQEMVYIGQQVSISKYNETQAFKLFGKDYRIDRNKAFIAGVIDSSRHVTLLTPISNYNPGWLSGTLMELCWLSDNGYKFQLVGGQVIGYRSENKHKALNSYKLGQIENPSDLYNKCEKVIREIESLYIELGMNTSLEKHEKKLEASAENLTDSEGFQLVINNKKKLHKSKLAAQNAQENTSQAIVSQFTQFVSTQTTLSPSLSNISDVAQNAPANNPDVAQNVPKA